MIAQSQKNGHLKKIETHANYIVLIRFNYLHILTAFKTSLVTSMVESNISSVINPLYSIVERNSCRWSCVRPKHPFPNENYNGLA